MVIHNDEDPHHPCDSISRVYRLEEGELEGISITFKGRVNLVEDERFARLPAVRRYLGSDHG